MVVGIDMMGGDFAPQEVALGVKLYLEDGKAQLVLIGDEKKIHQLLQEHKISNTSVTIVHAPEMIEMHEHPTKALKEKQKSSIAIGFQMLSGGKIDAFVSAGNTGAMLVGSIYSLKPIEGVIRPLISTIIPRENGTTGLLLDVGLNADCKPEQLNQFAIMGKVYAQQILGIENPRVALLNIGEEEGKGNLLTQAAYQLMKENTHIQFIGNVEGRDLFLDKADVMVCDGFTGNIILKMAESIFGLTQRQHIKTEYFDRFNFENYGGTPILGLSKPVIIGHGISKGKSFRNMIQLAQKMIDKDVMQRMKEEVEA